MKCIHTQKMFAAHDTTHVYAESTDYNIVCTEHRQDLLEQDYCTATFCRRERMNLAWLFLGRDRVNGMFCI